MFMINARSIKLGDRLYFEDSDREYEFVGLNQAAEPKSGEDMVCNFRHQHYNAKGDLLLQLDRCVIFQKNQVIYVMRNRPKEVEVVALKQDLKKGDWVFATDLTGSSITGQVTDDMSNRGSSLLRLAVGSGSASGFININVNYWDVEVTHKNNIPYSEEK